MRADYTTYVSTMDQVIEWAKAGQQRAVSLSCVNHAVESYPLFARRPLTQPSHQVASPYQQEG